MKPITRKQYADKLDALIGKGQIIVLTGQRRVGKSISSKIYLNATRKNRKPTLYINKERKVFDDIKNHEQLNQYIDEHILEDAHYSLLITHCSPLITQNLSYLCHLCAITHSGKIILQNHNKGDGMLMCVKEAKRQLGRKKCPVSYYVCTTLA